MKRIFRIFFCIFLTLLLAIVPFALTSCEEKETEPVSLETNENYTAKTEKSAETSLLSEDSKSSPMESFSVGNEDNSEKKAEDDRSNDHPCDGEGKSEITLSGVEVNENGESETLSDTDGKDKDANTSDGDAERASDIYKLILTHVSGIISVLTLAFSVILTNFHKKKLMPTLGGALGSIGEEVRSLGERAEVSLLATEETARRMNGKIADMNGVIESFNLTLSEIEKRMCELEDHKTKGESIKIMMRTEVDELSRIFSSSDLSEINRKTVEEKLTVIKSHLE